MVGRNEYRKGFHILIQALALIDKSIELHLVGDWPDIESTHHHVTYHGVVREKHDMMAIMDSCDVLLLPSLSEGMPTVVLEAKARGLHVIATDVGAMSKLEKKLIKPGSPRELSSHINDFPTNTCGERLSSEFSWKAIAANTFDSLVNDFL